MYTPFKTKLAYPIASWGWLLSLPLFIILNTNTQAQPLDMSLLEGMKARAIGPAGMSGRITSIDAVVKDPDVIYAGSASGGLWKSTDRGISWKPIFDDQKTSSIGAVAINQNNPDEVWVGTGEGNPRNSQNGGYGIYKSLDAGKSWKLLGLENTRNIHRIVIHRDNPNIVYVAAIGSPWGDHPERGVYKTTDGGKTWNKVLYLNEKCGAADLVVDPQNPNKILVSMWEHRRDPWFFKSGGKSSGLYMSVDGGENWERLSVKNGLPEGDLGRIGLAIAPSKPNLIYAIIESKKNAFYKSEDGGFNWKKVTDKGSFGNRPFYYADIYVDPQNENRIYSLWTYISQSDDGGRTWKIIADYGNGVHPDHHAYWIDPNDPEFLINGNDGGLFMSENGGKTWRFAENIPVGQFYHVNVDMDYPYNVYGGMQDNGSWQGPAYVLKRGGIRNAYWEELYFGDGFDAVPDPSDEGYVYAMSQGGNVGRVDLETGDSKNIQPIHPDGIELRFNWNAAIATDPFDKNTIYFGSQFVHKSTDRGNTWEIISPDLTTNDTTKQKQLESGGLTYDVTGAENFTTILAITPSTLEKEVIWVGTDDGNLQITRDGGQTWKNVISNIKGVPTGTWIPQVKASVHNAGEAFVVFDNHRRNDITPYAYHTKDYGKTWRRIADANKVWGYTLSILQDIEEPKLLFLGTDAGLYVSIDEGNNWTKWTQGYPTVPTSDLVIHPREHDLAISTFGRSMYILDDIRPLREMARQNNLMAKQVHVFGPPEGIQANYRQAAGTRFQAQAMFQGQNRRSGAMISYYVKNVKVKSKSKKSKEGNANAESTAEARSGTMSLDPEREKGDTTKITLEILNDQREVIRTLKQTPKPGVNRMYWQLDRKGIRFPRRNNPRPNAPEPGGPDVLPGTYTVRMTYGKDKDSTTIKVVPDPRINVPQSQRMAKNELIEEMSKGIELSAKAVKQLKESQEITNWVMKKIKGKDEKTKALKKQGKEVQKNLKSLLEMVLGQEGKQGIYRDPQQVTRKVGRSYSFIQSTWEAPNENEKIRVAQAQEALKEYLEKVNNFFANDWPAFQKALKAHEFTMFEEYKPLKLDD